MLETLKKLQTGGVISRAELTMAKKAIKADRKDLLEGFAKEIEGRLEDADRDISQKELIKEALEIINGELN